jgi:AraC family transcriptional regulator
MTSHDTREPVRFIQILQDPVTYHNFAGDLVRGGAVSLERRINVDDPLISRIALSIASDIEGGFLDHVLADALNTALAVRITRLFVDRSAINLAPSNGLSRARVKRVCDYIEAHLDDRLSLTEIAGVACLSPYHFSRSFKQAVGVGRAATSSYGGLSARKPFCNVPTNPSPGSRRRPGLPIRAILRRSFVVKSV